MQERATFGKADGNGLGLFHAAELMKKIGGKVEIQSAVGRGTTVSLMIRNGLGYEAAN
jgi:signal transduction histidine kinase